MTKRKNSTELDLQVHTENKDKLHNLLNNLRRSIDDDKMPKAKELLKISNKNDKILRPPNSYIIYTNQLNNFGLLKTVGEYCEKYQITKEDLVPISKKLSKELWKELSEKYQEFFRKLALEVKMEHENLYPDYKFDPKRKSRRGTIKQYIPPQQEEEPSEDNNEPMEDAFDDSQDSEEDDFPTFDENPPLSPEILQHSNHF